MRVRACALAASVLCACGGPAAERPIVVTNDVSIAIVPARPDMPFDPRAARLTQAARQLAAVAGHPVSFRIDAALVPPFASSLEESLAESVEQVTRDLGALKEQQPAIYAREVPLLHGVECRYAATADRPDARFDASAGTVLVSESTPASFVDRGVVAGALEDDYGAWLDSTFEGVAPDGVRQAQWEAYFTWASSSRSWRSRGPDAPADPQRAFEHDPRGEALLAVARFARLSGAGAGDAALARRIDEHLVSEMYYLLLAYENDGPRVRAAGPTSLFRRAESAWVEWLRWRLPLLDPHATLTVAERIFDAQRCGSGCIPYRERLPGFDPFSFGLAVADSWVHAGHPADGADGDARFGLMDLVVCPVFQTPEGKHDRNRGCGGGWFKQAMADDALRGPLAAALGARGDGALVTSLVWNLKYDAGASVALWRALGPYEAAWRAAARVVIADLLGDHTSDLLTEAEHVWAAMPDRRGTALYLMARLDAGLDPVYADPRWASFEKRFGGRVTQGTFAAMLEESPLAVNVARVVWPALGTGWSRADVLLPRLGRFLDEPSVRRGDDGEPGATVRALAKRMCDDGASADLAKLHASLTMRAGSGQGAIGPLAEDTAADRCGRLRGR